MGPIYIETLYIRYVVVVVDVIVCNASTFCSRRFCVVANVLDCNIYICIYSSLI